MVLANSVGPAAPESAREEQELDLGRLLNALWRGKFVIALFALLGAVWGYNQAYRVAVPIYSATALMALDFRTEQVADLQSVLSGVSPDEYSMNTEMEIIRSGELITRLVRELNLVEDPEFNPYLPRERKLALGDLPGLAIDAAVGAIVGREEPSEAPPRQPSEADVLRAVVGAVRGRISAEIEEWSYTFTITATSEDPAKAALLANTLAQIYRNDQVELKREANEEAAEWLSARVTELQAELEAQQDRINELRAQSGLLSAEAFEVLNLQAVEQRTRVAEAEAALARAEDRDEALRSVIDGDIEVQALIADDPQLTALASPAVAGDQEALARFGRRFEQIVAESAADFDRARTQLASLRESAERLSAQVEEQSADLISLQEIEREARATQVLYETFLARLKEATVGAGVYAADSRILSEAAPGGMIAPRRSRILGGSLLVGMVLGALIVVIRELMHNTFRSAEELEKTLGRAVLGQVPRVPVRARQDVIPYLIAKPASAAAEAIRDLRTSILMSELDRPPKVIMLASSIPGEGKTTLSLALAQNLAGLGKKVLVVEGDIRRRTFGAYFPEAKGKTGLLSVLSGSVPLQDAVFRNDKMGIDVLIGERSSANAADVFSSESFRHHVEAMRAAFDFVIIDTPPVLVVPDARVIGQLADAIVYVVKWDSTSRAQVADGLKQFESVNLHVTGLALTQFDPDSVRRYGYGGRYSAYSRYSKGYYEA